MSSKPTKRNRQTENGICAETGLSLDKDKRCHMAYAQIGSGKLAENYRCTILRGSKRKEGKR